MCNDNDTVSRGAGVWPDAILSGHAHLYQRFTRTVDGQQIPYIVSGSGGYNAKASPQGNLGQAPVTQGDTTLEIDPVIQYGYLTVTVDMTAGGRKLTIAFHSPKLGRNYDHVAIDRRRRRALLMEYSW